MRQADGMRGDTLHTHTAAGMGVASQRDGSLLITQRALAIMGDAAVIVARQR